MQKESKIITFPSYICLLSCPVISRHSFVFYFHRLEMSVFSIFSTLVHKYSEQFFTTCFKCVSFYFQSHNPNLNYCPLKSMQVFPSLDFTILCTVKKEVIVIIVNINKADIYQMPASDALYPHPATCKDCARFSCIESFREDVVSIY